MTTMIKLKPPQKIFLIMAGITLVTIAVYWQVNAFEFTSFDDDIYVTQNKQVLQGMTREGLAWAFSPRTNDEKTYWHPLTWLSHMLDVELFGIDPAAHHLMNLALHVINMLLLFLTLHLMTGALWQSAFAAALFALHPINVDSVAWVAERKNLLSTTFWMLTMLAYVRYAQKPAIARYLLICLALTLGLLAKPMLVTLPCVLLLLDAWPLGRIRPGQIWPAAASESPLHKYNIMNLVVEKLPLLAISLTGIGLALFSLQSGDAPAGPGIGPPMLLRMENAIVSYAVYLWKLIWPVRLAFYYPFPSSVPGWQTAAAFLLIALITATAILRAHKNPYLTIGWLWYLGTLVPVLGLTQVGLWPALADRWAYIPFIGLYIAIAWGLTDLFAVWESNKKAWFFPAVALLCLSSLLTFRQAGHWRSSRSLYEHAIAVTAGNFVAHNNLGNVYQTEGQTEAAIREYWKALESNPVYTTAMFNIGVVMQKEGRHEEAVRYLAEVLRLDPGYANAHNTMGLVLNETGRPEEAVLHFSKAINIKPNHEQAHNNLAAVLTGLGRYGEAVFHARQATQIMPNYAEAYFNLGTALSRSSKPREAMAHFLKAIDIKPDMADAHIGLANVFYNLGKLDQAIFHYRKALEMNPGSTEAHANLANAMGAKGQTDEAISHYRKATAINPDIPETYNNLGVALIRKGDIAQAMDCFQTAITLWPGYESAINNLRRLEQMQK